MPDKMTTEQELKATKLALRIAMDQVAALEKTKTLHDEIAMNAPITYIDAGEFTKTMRKDCTFLEIMKSLAFMRYTYADIAMKQREVKPNE